MRRRVDLSKVIELYEANEKLKGTYDYSKYQMCYETKMDNKWCYCGWGVPFILDKNYIEDCYLKTYGHYEYLYIEYRNGPERWALTDNVREFLSM